ncbi:hypothetical protein OG900_09165 [Streptomyces sp. NBC_00433]
MTIRNRFAVAATAAALAGGLAVATPVAHADNVAAVRHTAAVATVVPSTAHAKTHTIWHAKFKPRHATWTSGAFGVRRYNVTVKYRCWNGGDGTKAKAKIVESDYPYRTLGTHSYSTCSGHTWHFKSTKVKPNTPYKIVITQNHGRTHTEEVWVRQSY